MERFESKTHSLLLTTLEMATILRKPEGSLFSPNGFILYRVSMWVSFVMVILSSSVYLTGDGRNKFLAFVLDSTSFEFLVCSLVLITKKENIEKMLRASTKVLCQLTPDDKNLQKIDLVDKKSLMFVRSFGILIFSNLISAVVQGVLMTWLSGHTRYPFEMSCLGLPTLPCWLFQLFSTIHVTIFGISYFAVLKLITYQLWFYVDVLSEVIRDRSVSASEKDDRDLLKLYCDFGHFAVSFSNIFGITALIEITVTSLRSCFQSYHVIKAISEKNWENAAFAVTGFFSSMVLPYIVCSCGEDMNDMHKQLRTGFLDSKWYECSPQSRKRLLPILALNRVPIRFQYRQYMNFNMELFMQVIRSTYSLTATLANFV